MPAPPIEVARNQWGAVLHHPDTQLLELKWFASTREMTDADFKGTLDLYATQGERLQPIRSGLIDATEFFHAFADPTTLAWRDEHIIPRYNAIGMARFAFHMPPSAPGTIEAGGVPAVEGRAALPTAWFSTRQRADAWLAETS